MQYIYKITNDFNDLVYIGLTNNIERRMNEHRLGHDIENSPIDKSIRKHGWEHFSYEIIDQTEDREKLKELEIKYISQYNSYHNGYNATLGGDDVTHLINVKGENNPRALCTEEDVKNIRKRRMNGERSSTVYNDYKHFLKRDTFNTIWQHHSWVYVCPEYQNNYPLTDTKDYGTITKNNLTPNDMIFLQDYFKWHGPVKYNIPFTFVSDKVDWESFQSISKNIVEKLYGNKSTRRYRNKNGETNKRISNFRKELKKEPIYIEY